MLKPLLVLSVLVSARAGANPERARKFMTELVQVAQHSKDSGGKVDDAAKKEVADISAQIDFEALSRKALAPRWARFPLAERQQFLATLQDLLETVAYPNAKKLAVKPDDLTYAAVPGKPGQVRVTGQMNREKNGDIVTTQVEVIVIYDTKGKVVDAVLEGELLSANLNKQFTESLKKQTFGQIIDKMKKRVADAKAPKAATPAAAKAKP